MVAFVNFEWDSRDLDIWRGDKTEKALTRAVRLAGNRAIAQMQDSSTEHVTSKKYLREGDVREGLPLDKPGTAVPLRDLEWAEKVSGEPMPVSKFPHIQTAFGVSVRINRGSGTKRIKSAFGAAMSSGHEGVFRRKGKERLPIQELWTSRISDSMQDAGAVDAVQAKAMAKYESAFAKGMDREFAKLKRKGAA